MFALRPFIPLVSTSSEVYGGPYVQLRTPSDFVVVIIISAFVRRVNDSDIATVIRIAQ